ncbi:alpha beta hydrolase [Trichoderma cornu-damae]|uniref:Alpha beta hydrolase n=1 Tax=Trichoderma cornu-damae TaxID=654480 RepID=A0A9P8QF68_9HYPO|nr:alpha beta hydrolase [Trichoderma cornu-damae]
MTTAEGKFDVGNASLYTKTWTPTGPIAAKVVFVHGFSEHINRYNDFFPKLAENGIQVFAWDQRGWGRSVTKPAEKGLTGPTAQVVADVAAFIQDKLPSDVPIFVMGHSMGGGEVLTLAGDAQHRQLVGQIRGWILEAPFIGFSAGAEPSSVKVFMGRLVGRMLPRQQLKHVVPPEHLSRDPAIVDSIKNDELCHNTGTLQGLASLMDRTAALASGGVKLGADVHSLLLAHGTSDMTCSHDAAMKFLKDQTAVEDKEAKSYDGAYHQLHSDHCKDEFTRDVVDWILKRSKIEPKL